MTTEQLFNAIDCADDLFLKEILEDLQPRKKASRFGKLLPILKIAAGAAACLAVAVGLVIGIGHIGLVQPEPDSPAASVSANNFSVEFGLFPLNPSSNDLLGSDKLSIPKDNTRISTTVKISYNKLYDSPSSLTARIQLFADGEPLPFTVDDKSILQYRTLVPENEGISKYNYEFLFFNEDIALHDFPSSGWLQIPVSFTVDKDVRQITVAAQFDSVNSSDYHKSFSELVSRTYPNTAALPESGGYSANEYKSFANSSKNTGYFLTETNTSYVPGYGYVFTHDNNLSLKVEHTSDIPYYLFVLKNGEPIPCFDNDSYSVLVDPTKFDPTRPLGCFTSKIPESFLSQNSDYVMDNFQLLAVPVVESCNAAKDGLFVPAVSENFNVVIHGDNSYSSKFKFDVKDDFLEFDIHPVPAKYWYGIYHKEWIEVIIGVRNYTDKPIKIFDFDFVPENIEVYSESPFLLSISNSDEFDENGCFLDGSIIPQNVEFGDKYLILEPGQEYYGYGLFKCTVDGKNAYPGRYRIFVSYKYETEDGEEGIAVSRSPFELGLH